MPTEGEQRCRRRKGAEDQDEKDEEDEQDEEEKEEEEAKVERVNGRWTRARKTRGRGRKESMLKRIRRRRGKGGVLRRAEENNMELKEEEKVEKM